MDKITYQIGDALYINLTNRCSNACNFCVRNNAEGVGGYHLWIDEEPSAQEVLQSIGDSARYSEIVFCGYGEPMIKINEIIEISRELKKKSAVIRINTNGQANMIHHENVVPRLKGLIDSISISLNAGDAMKYQEMCQSEFGADAFYGVIEFARECVKVIPKVILSVVDILPEEEIKKCQRIADDVGARLRIRDYIE